MTLLALALSLLPALAEPPQIPDFGADALVSSVAGGMQIAGSGQIGGGVVHANLFWTAGSYAEICVEKKGGSTARAYTFSVVYPDGAGLPDVSNPVWSGVSFSPATSGGELLCAPFTSGSQDDPSQFVADELVVDEGEVLWLLLESGTGTSTSLYFGEIPTSGPVLVRRKLTNATTGTLLAPVRAAADLGSGFEPLSSGAVLIYLVDAL